MIYMCASNLLLALRWRFVACFTNLQELLEGVLGYDELWVFLLDVGVSQGLDHGRLAGEEDTVGVGVLAVGQEVPRLNIRVTGQYFPEQLRESLLDAGACFCQFGQSWWSQK